MVFIFNIGYMATIDVWTQWIGDMQLEKSLKLLKFQIYIFTCPFIVQYLF